MSLEELGHLQAEIEGSQAPKLGSLAWMMSTAALKPKHWGRLGYSFSVIHFPSPKRIFFLALLTSGLVMWLALANQRKWYLPLLIERVVHPLFFSISLLRPNWQLGLFIQPRLKWKEQRAVSLERQIMWMKNKPFLKAAMIWWLFFAISHSSKS